MRTWWVVANERQGWHWNRFFRSAARSRRGVDKWGGPGWIKSARSRVHADEMGKGDMVVAYQAGEGVRGFVWLASDGYVGGSSGRADKFDIAYRGALWLETPVSIRVVKQLPNAMANFEFVSFHNGTVFSVSPAGRVQLGLLAAAFNPGSVGTRCITLTASQRDSCRE